MSRSRKYWKFYAKKSLKGNWGIDIAGMLAVAAVNFIGNMMAVQLFSGNSVFSLALSQVFVFIFSLIAMIFRTGYNYMLLNQARGKEFSLGNLMYLFHNNPDRVLVAGFVVSLLSTAVQIPFYYMVYMSEPGTTGEQQIQWAQMMIILFVLSLVLNVVITVPFALTFYFLADNPDMGGMEALKGSARLMKKHILKYWIMMLSFVPLLILSLFTMYLALLWVIPYMYMTEVVFYMDIRGEFLQEQESEKQEDSRENTHRTDDYNSEA